MTAEEWKRRFEKERELTHKLRLIIQQQEAELGKWRAGETVPEAERSKLKLKQVVAPVEEAVSGPQGTQPVTLQLATPTSQLTTPTGATPTPVQTRAFEEERSRLCQQLDEKVDQSTVVHT